MKARLSRMAHEAQRKFQLNPSLAGQRRLSASGLRRLPATLSVGLLSLACALAALTFATISSKARAPRTGLKQSNAQALDHTRSSPGDKPQTPSVTAFGIRDIGTFGGFQSFAVALNDHNQVIGHAEDHQGQNIAFLYSNNNGQLVDIGTLGTPHSTLVVALNNSGDVTGTSGTITGERRAFLYHNGQMTAISPLDANFESFPIGISDNGAVVGYGAIGVNGTVHPFLYADNQVIDLDPNSYVSVPRAINSSGVAVGAGASENQDIRARIYNYGLVIDIGTLEGYFISEAVDINDGGQVACNASELAGVDLQRVRAFMYVNGSKTDIGTLGGTNSKAVAINNNGVVVGFSNTLGDIQTHAFTYDYSSGLITDIGTLGGPQSLPVAINDLGQVLGTSTTLNGETHAFIWDSVNGMRDINNLIPANSGWHTISDVKGLNNLGSVTGTALNIRPVPNAFIAGPTIQTPRPVISGTIKDNQNNPLSGVTVGLTGNASGTTQTDANGHYSFANLIDGGEYIVYPSLSNYTFTPDSYVFDGPRETETADFTGALNHYTVSGHVSNVNGALGNVTVMLSGSQSAMTQTDANGDYLFLNLPAGGNYTVTASFGDYTFDPNDAAFNNLSSDHFNVNFYGTLPARNLAGRVTNGHGAGVAGVKLMLGGAQSQIALTDANGDYAFDSLPGGGNYTITASLRNYTFSPPTLAFNNLTSDQQGNFNATPHIAFDFDADARTDVAVWQSNLTNWQIRNSFDETLTVHLNWGSSALGDICVPGDYDGDGRTDLAIWRPGEGNWYVIKSSDGQILLKGWGQSGDRPVPGDYDGDKKTDFAVFRPAEGNWYIINSSDNSVSLYGWGAGSDEIVPGDYDGDGRTDVAVWRASEGNWYVIKSSGGVLVQNWGGVGDRPVPADYDGDGKTDFSVFRPSEGNWYIINSSFEIIIFNRPARAAQSPQGGGGGGGASEPTTLRQWGVATDKPVPGDYDGDGKADIAVFRPAEGNWYIIRSSDDTVLLQNLGTSDDTPVPSAFIP